MKHSVGLFAACFLILTLAFLPHFNASAQELAKIIFSIAWSPDGSKIAVGTFSKIEILDAKDGTLLKTLRGSSGAVSVVDWSPDSKKLAGASFDINGLAVWDVATGQIVAAQSFDAIAVKWNPDNIRLAAADTSINIGIWNTLTLEDELLAIPGNAMDWSPDGSKLASASYSDSPIQIRDIATQETLLTLPGHAYGVEDLDWSPDGSKIASGGPDKIVNIWNAETGEALFTLTGHTDVVSAVAWNWDSLILASASSDGTIRFWDAQTGESISIVQGEGQIRAISWSSDGRQLVYGGDEGIVHIIPAPQVQATPPTPQNDVHSNTILLLREASMMSWNLDTLTQTPYLDLADNILRPDGLLADDKLIIMNRQLDHDAHAIYFLMGFGQNGLTPPQHTKMMRVDLSNFEKTTLFEKEGLSNFALSPNNQSAIVTYYEGEYGKSRQYSCVLDLTSGNCTPVDVVVGNRGWAWVNDDSYIILSPADRKFNLINVNTLETHPLPMDDSWYLYSFTLISGTRNLLISARQRTNTNSDASQFLTLDLDTAEVTDFTYDAVSGEYSSVSDWQFSPDGKYLLYGSVSERALIDFHTGELIAEFKDATQAEWLTDSNDLLITRWQEQGKILEIIRFNIESGQSEILIEGQDLGYIIVPHTPIPAPTP